MKFTKYEGAGNDFIICKDIENIDVVKLCDRHYGIGADGVIVVSNENKKIVDIKIYNSDGSEAKTCGNGLRCVGAYLKNINNKKEYTVKTIAGLYKINCLGNNDYEVGFPLVLSVEKEDNYYVVNSGNMHVFTIDNINLNDFINKIRIKYDSNVEIVEILDRETIKIQVNERGVGETLACGSACIAIVSALYKYGLVDNEVTCINKGGKLKVRLENNLTYLIGEAKFIFRGDYNV